ncbi:MAG: hypothetical protein KJP04_11965, partial [Arenicella sp.]|nr:hypothetical protein [Arenicella sp.]
VDGGNPVGKSQTVHPDKSISDDGGANPLSGYSIIKADDAGAAAELAKGCPVLKVGGSVEIAPIVEM